LAGLAVLARIQTTAAGDGLAASWNPGASTFDSLPAAEKKKLLEAREAVWRAFFTNDQKQLDRLLPEDTITLDGPLENPFVKKAQILEFAKQTAQGGTKLVRLEFPLTEMQVYGDTVIIYTTYLYELENAQGERRASKGRATEIFVRRKGEWLNPGWHLTPAE
jgi:ketosteroid isomerase-like protein